MGEDIDFDEVQHDGFDEVQHDGMVRCNVMYMYVYHTYIIVQTIPDDMDTDHELSPDEFQTYDFEVIAKCVQNHDNLRIL